MNWFFSKMQKFNAELVNGVITDEKIDLVMCLQTKLSDIIFGEHQEVREITFHLNIKNYVYVSKHILEGCTMRNLRRMIRVFKIKHNTSGKKD